MTIKDVLLKEGYEVINQGFYQEIDAFKSWYRGEVKEFHQFYVYNGNRRKKCRMHSLQMAKKVCEDWANLLLNEKVKINISGKKEQLFFDSVMMENNWSVKSNEMQEMKMALGTVAYVPYAYGVEVDSETGTILGGKGIKLAYVTAEHIYPLAWDNGVITECAFVSEQKKGQKTFIYLQMHLLEKGEYIIKNRYFESNNGRLQEIGATGNTAPIIKTGSTEPLFIIDKPNIVNNIAATVPMGISVFANSIDVLKGIDIVYDSYNNEFILGKKRIMVAEEAIEMRKDQDGNPQPVFDDSELVYYKLPQGMSDEPFIKEINMELRTADHETALHNRLNLLSTKCGFGENYYRFNGGNIATATQVISENATLFRTLKKHELVLENALRHLVKAILIIGNNVMGLDFDINSDVNIDFDDSIIIDTDAEKTQFLQEIRDGVRKKWEYRVRFLGEDKQTAIENTMESNDTTEGNSETEGNRETEGNNETKEV